MNRARFRVRHTPSARHLSDGVGFWIVTVAFLVVMGSTTAQTPLYSLYQAREGLPTFIITVIFGAGWYLGYGSSAPSVIGLAAGRSSWQGQLCNSSRGSSRWRHPRCQHCWSRG
jgi:hypothetical protein